MIYRAEQHRLCFLLLIIFFLFQSTAIASEDIANEKSSTITETLINDHKSFYSGERLTRIGLGFGLGAILANTTIDNQIQKKYQDDIRSSSTDDFAKSAKLFGEGIYLIPLSLLSASINYFDNNSPIGDWGAYSARAYLIGAPGMLLMQRVTGGSRPGETNHDSNWRPFDDSNGVSGHAFIGAVPFLTLAKMNRDNTLLRYIAYIASTASAWSRVNDNAHYLSQVGLGWYLAWESVGAVFDVDKQYRKVSIAPLIGQDSFGIAVNIKW
ncbi:MAG: phosphatase PAP2 family protein [Thermodesulfobacteriota bacterium]